MRLDYSVWISILERMVCPETWARKNPKNKIFLPHYFHKLIRNPLLMNFQQVAFRSIGKHDCQWLKSISIQLTE